MEGVAGVDDVPGGEQALAIIADAAAGKQTEPWESENYTVIFSESELTFQNKWIESDYGKYAAGEARAAVEDYWRFLISLPDNPELIREFRPDLPEWQAALLLWEDSWKRTHPYPGNTLLIEEGGLFISMRKPVRSPSRQRRVRPGGSDTSP